MKSSTLALLIGSTTATAITPWYRCNLDLDEGSATLKYDTTKIKAGVTVAAFDSLTDNAAKTQAECQTKGAAAVTAATPVSTSTYCVQFEAGATHTCKFYEFVTADLTAGKDPITVKLDKFATVTDLLAPAVFKMVGTDATIVAPTYTKDAANKMVSGKKANTAITWTDAAQTRVTGGMRINSPMACQAACTAVATADSDATTGISSKVGVCSFEQKVADPAAVTGMGACNWGTAAKASATKDKLPLMAGAATATSAYFAAVYQGNATPIAAWVDPATPAKPEDTKKDEKKEDSAFSLAAGAASLMTAAMLY